MYRSKSQQNFDESDQIKKFEEFNRNNPVLLMRSGSDFRILDSHVRKNGKVVPAKWNRF